jgi:hypothetical protein
MLSRDEWPTAEETAVAAEVRRDLASRFPGVRVEVEVRLCCPAVADTFMPCEEPHNHKGKHRLHSKDRSW